MHPVERTPIPSPRKGLIRGALGLSLVSLLVTACDPLGAQPETNPAAVTEKYPDCVEMTPPADLAAAISEAQAKLTDHWASQGIVLGDKPPIYYEASDGPCLVDGEEPLQGPSYIPRFDRLAIQPDPRLDLSNQVVVEFVVGHEGGHEVQMLTREIYGAATEQQQDTLDVLEELQADYFAGEFLQLNYPAHVPDAAALASKLGGEENGEGSQRKAALLMGAAGGDNGSYEAIATEVGIEDFPFDAS